MRRIRLRLSLWVPVISVLLFAAGLAAALSTGAEAPQVAGKRARDFFPRNPLLYVELRDLAAVDDKLAGFKLWADRAAARKQIDRLTAVAAKQLSLLVGQDKPEAGKAILKQIKNLHLAVYPPAAFPPEMLVAVEVEAPAKLLKSLSAGGAATRIGAHRGHDLYRLGFSMNGFRKSTFATVAGKTVLLSPYLLRVRQALDVAASGKGALAVSPGFADCARRFSTRPLWGYINVEALASFGALDDMMAEEMQGLVVAMGLPSYRWAGFASTLGEGKTPFEFHLAYYDWSPLAGLAAPLKAPAPALAAAAPAEAMAFAAINVNDPVKAWTRIKDRIKRLAPEFRVMDGGDDFDAESGGKTVKMLTEQVKMALGADLEKDILPLLSGDVGFFVVNAENPMVGLLLAAKDEAGAKKLMARFKVKPGTIATVGGGQIHATRIGRIVLLCDGEKLAKQTVAAAAAGKTIAASAAYKAEMTALGEAKGLVAYFPVSNVHRMLQAMGLGKLIARKYSAACSATLTNTGFTFKTTAPIEALAIVPLLSELESIIRDMERNAVRRRMQNIANAATAFARRNKGRWPNSFDELGASFKPGSPARRSPASGKEFAIIKLGKVPPKAARHRLLLCYQPDAKGSERAVLVRSGRAYVQSMSGKLLAARARQTLGILAVADPKRNKLTDSDKKAAAEGAKDLGNDNFAKREAATTKLRDLGVKAIPTLLRLLKSGDAEVSSRAEELLKKLTGLKTAAEVKQLAP
jgi:hypothetical protein